MKHPQPTPALFTPLRIHLESDAPCAAASPNGELSLPSCDVFPRDVPSPVVIATHGRTYICPGEKHAIPRSIHLARLAAFYPKCRHCEHRDDTGHLPRSKVDRLEQSVQRAEPVSPFHAEGIRGVYLNQLTRQSAARIAAVVAAHLWDSRPLMGRPPGTDREPGPPAGRRGIGPLVVIGQDWRPSSPDLSVGISESLRRMGCEVIDVGRVSRPCLAFAVHHLQSAAGVYVTGSGCPDSWTGIDLFGAGAIPWSKGGTLDAIEARDRREASRSTRQGGGLRFFDVLVPYRAGLLKHFQELPPLRVVCSCPEPTVIDSLAAIFDGPPCELIVVPAGAAGYVPVHTEERDVSAIRDAIRESSADCGVFISEDGAAIRLLTSDGREVALRDWFRRLLRQPGSSPWVVPVTRAAGEDAAEPLSELGFGMNIIGESAESLAAWMDENSTPVGVQSAGRIWFRDAFPQCDALITFGRLLQSLTGDHHLTGG